MKYLFYIISIVLFTQTILKMNSNSNNSKINSNKPFCKVCKDAGKTEKEYTSHYTKNRGVTICPTLLSTICSHCGKSGHIKSYCEEYKKQPQPPQQIKSKRCTYCEKNKRPEREIQSHYFKDRDGNSTCRAFDEDERISNLPHCNYCEKAGKHSWDIQSHNMKDKKGKITCPLLLSTKCSFCSEHGHTHKFCPVLQEAKEREEREQVAIKSAPTANTKGSWANKVASGFCDKAVLKRMETTDESQPIVISVVEKFKLAQEKRKQEYEEAQAQKMAKIEKEIQRQQQGVEQYKRQYGKEWFIYIEETDFDNEEAEFLREFYYEREENEMYKKWDADHEKIQQMKSTMTPQELADYEMNEEEEMQTFMDNSNWEYHLMQRNLRDKKHN